MYGLFFENRIPIKVGVGKIKENIDKGLIILTKENITKCLKLCLINQPKLKKFDVTEQNKD